MNNVLPFVMRGGKGEKGRWSVAALRSYTDIEMNDSLPACQSSSDWHWADSTAYTPPHSRWRQTHQAPPTSGSMAQPRFPNAGLMMPSSVRGKYDNCKMCLRPGSMWTCCKFLLKRVKYRIPALVFNQSLPVETMSLSLLKRACVPVKIRK